jgi:hypothetical protein
MKQHNTQDALTKITKDRIGFSCPAHSLMDKLGHVNRY